MENGWVNRNEWLSFVIALAYVSIGTFELLTEGDVSIWVDSLADGLDLYLVLPSHLFGTLLGVLARNNYEEICFIWIGQIINLFVVAFLVHNIRLIFKLLIKK